MKVLLGWLKDFVAIEESPEKLAGILTEQGFEVEAIVPTGSMFDRIVVGEIIEREPLDSDTSLLRCGVSVGDRAIQTVCGDPKVKVGNRVPVALPGAELGGGMRVETGRVAGVESEAVLCSLFDLGLRSVQDEVHCFGGTPALGSAIAPLLDLEDHLLEIELTPNRGDCLSIQGMAREIAAATGRILQVPDAAVEEGPGLAGERVAIDIEARDLCPKYVARIVENVSVCPSPLWLTRRLRLMGLRPISNVVDVSNYVLLEMGQPLHTFDYSCLAGGRIVVRRGKAGEEFVALDETIHRLDSEVLVIADGEKPVALAGVMGGINSGVVDTTKVVLIESAHFDAVNIRKTARKRGLSTEASMRFERGIDPGGVERAADRCARLLAEVANGTVLSGRVEAGDGAPQRKSISLRVRRANVHLGISLESSEMGALLQALDFEVTGDDVLEVTPPGFRNDVTMEADLVEEVARMRGYSKIPVDMEKHRAAPASETPRARILERVREVLGGLGLNEAVTGTLREPGDLLALGRVSEEEIEKIRLKNPLSQDQSVLRPSLIPGLVACVRTNLNRRRENVRLYEIGTVFRPAADSARPREATHLAGILTGLRDPVSWGTDPVAVDFYDLRGLLEDLAGGLRLPGIALVPDEIPTLESRCSVRVEVGEESIGCAGRLDPELGESIGVKEAVFLFELVLDKLVAKALGLQQFRVLPRFPAVGRDLAIVVGEDVPYERISGTIREKGEPLLRGVRLFDVYRGEQVPRGKRSLAYSLIFRSDKRTLTDEEVDDKLRTITGSLQQDFGAVLRSEVV
ncbi:MAG: phenylalanine--tRNA ligase subunit beta [Candidatus Eisenbacteria sp.]|nr:phenylalanine--tRNA ligase subunit beta [Candidatus Eisenbacteria bacterium]